MKDKYYLNKEIGHLVHEYTLNKDKSLKAIREDAGIKSSYFGKLIHFNSKYAKVMNEELALKILLAIDYPLSEAKLKLAEIKANEALVSLTDQEKQKVINNVIEGVTINGDNNVFSQSDNITINN